MKRPWTRLVEAFEDGAVDEAMASLVAELAKVRIEGGRPALELLEQDASFRRLRTIVHEDPYTRRGYEKPRGYPGDAVLLDLVYGIAPLPDATTARGEAIFDWCQAHSDAFASVKARKAHFSARIDGVVDGGMNGSIVSIACGHFREAHDAMGLRAGLPFACIAVDQDPRSVKVVGAHFAHRGVTPVVASVAGILRGRFHPGPCALVYAAGLFDYLPDDLASALLRRMSSWLVAGGELVVPHFTRMAEAGYIEALMHWHLIYRDGPALLALAERSCAMRGRTADTWTDDTGCVTYLRLREGDRKPRTFASPGVQVAR